MTKIEKACALFTIGYHCSQAVFAAYCGDYGLEEKTALKISAPFGSGMNKGEVCGAVTGALMIIGLKYGQYDLSDTDSRNKTAEKTKQFLDKFSAVNGSYMCRNLLKYDFADKAQCKYIIDTKLWKDICPEIVKSACIILEEVIKDD